MMASEKSASHGKEVQCRQAFWMRGGWNGPRILVEPQIQPCSLLSPPGWIRDGDCIGCLHLMRKARALWKDYVPAMYLPGEVRNTAKSGPSELNPDSRMDYTGLTKGHEGGDGMRQSQTSRPRNHQTYSAASGFALAAAGQASQLAGKKAGRIVQPTPPFQPRPATR